MHDALAAAVTLHPELVTTASGRVEVITSGDTVGQSILLPGDGPVEVAFGVDVVAATEVIVTALVRLCGSGVIGRDVDGPG